MGFEPKALSVGDGIKYSIKVTEENNLETLVEVERWLENSHGDMIEATVLRMDVDELGLLGEVASSAYLEHNCRVRMEVSPSVIREDDVIDGLGRIRSITLTRFKSGVKVITALIGDSNKGAKVSFRSDHSGRFDQLIGISRLIYRRSVVD